MPKMIFVPPEKLPPANVIAEISEIFPHFSRKQVHWFANACADPRRMSNDHKLCLTVLCQAAGPDLPPVKLSDREIARRVNAIGDSVRAYIVAGGSLVDRPTAGIMGLTGAKRFGTS